MSRCFIQAYIYFDQYRIIVEQMTTSIGLCLLAVTVISALVLAHPLSVLIVFVVLALVFTDLMGSLIQLDVHLDGFLFSLPSDACVSPEFLAV